jgi:N4-bis(aminopropyl)spermidine synthase
VDPTDRVAELIAAAGAGGRRLREAILLLAERPRTLDELIRATALSRRTLESLLDAARPDLTTAGDRFGLRPDRSSVYRRRFAIAHHEASAAELEAAIGELVAAAPAARWRLDQVAATPKTLVRRARWLDATYDLAGTGLLCVGDHDLTSLAVCLVNPAVRIGVVDVDEPLLAYIDGVAARHGWSIACRYADLRFGLPPSLAGSADLAFTDPPYTPDGLALFCLRGSQGLRAPVSGRLLVAYGYGDSQPALGLKAQRAMQSLHLAFEAILPAFNRYAGAQAIGAGSDLYVCRPTAQTARLLAERPPAVDSRVYTQGPQSPEAEPSTVDPSTVDRAMSVVDAAREAPLLVGPGWPDLHGAPRLGLGRLLTHGATSLPPAPAGRDRVVLVDLGDDPGGWLLRVLLSVDGARVVAVGVGGEAPADLVGPKYRLESRRGLLVATPVELSTLDSRAFLRRWVLDRAHGKLANVWREGLIHLDALSKNQARARIAAIARRPDALDAALVELPEHLVAVILADVAASVE